MYCPKCGAQSDSVKFCRSCGTNLTRVSEVIERPAGASEQPSAVSVFSERKVSNRNRLVKGLNAGSIFGSLKLDLTAERLPEGETKITLFGVFGSTEVLVPDDVGVHVTGFTLFAAANVRGKDGNSGFGTLDYVSDNYETASRRLRIEATAVFAEVKIKGPK
ncbi:MAG TPA: LiaF domain-containing protein [Blastocatellia bacterium]|nr:LiaF domain-containing protein [Blastocatellia bacterium]